MCKHAPHICNYDIYTYMSFIKVEIQPFATIWMNLTLKESGTVYSHVHEGFRKIKTMKHKVEQCFPGMVSW